MSMEPTPFSLDPNLDSFHVESFELIDDLSAGHEYEWHEDWYIQLDEILSLPEINTSGWDWLSPLTDDF